MAYILKGKKLENKSLFENIFGDSIKSSEIINPIRGIFSLNLQSKIKRSVVQDKRKNNSFVN